MKNATQRIEHIDASRSQLLGLLGSLTVLSLFGARRLGVNNAVDAWLPDNDSALLVVPARR